MSLLGQLAVVAGRATAAASTSLASVVDGAGRAYQNGLQQAEDTRKALVLSHRADRIGIPAPWYNAIAEEFGEEPLIEAAAMAKSEQSEGESVFGKIKDWRALAEDPFEPVASWGGWRERPSALSYELQEVLSRRVGPFTAYLQTRLKQISLFCTPQEDGRGVGFQIRPKGAAQVKGRPKDLTHAQKKRAAELRNVISNCGFTPRYDPETGETRDDFHAMMQKVFRDALIHDQGTFEKRRDLKGRPVEWRATDAKTIRRTTGATTAENWFGEPIRYAQILHGSIVSDFSSRDLAFWVRNPRSDVRVYGYGMSELEMMVGTVTALLNGFEHNARFFSQGTTAKGVLTITGLVPPNRLRAFRHMWYAMVSGAGNAWRTPILNIPDEKAKIGWVDVQKTNLDMEWSKFMDYCTKVMCAVALIAPEEIGFQFGNTGQTSSMSEGSNVAAKMESSKDKGLQPQLESLERCINSEIMALIDPDWEFSFVGLDGRSEKDEVEQLVKEVGAYRKVDEAREARGLAPLANGDGDMVLSPTWVQWKSQKDMAAQQAQQQGGGGGFPGMAGFMGGQPSGMSGGGGDDGGYDGGGGQGQEEPGAGPPQPGAVQKSLRSGGKKRDAATLIRELITLEL